MSMRLAATLVTLSLGLAGIPTSWADARAQEQEAPTRLELGSGDRIVLIGNTLAERMQYFGRFETLLQSRFPEHELVVRNLGWSADELALRPRSRDFQDHGHTLQEERPDVLVAAFGFNESFAGPRGLKAFADDLDAFLEESTTTAYNGQEPPQLVLLSPIGHEDLGNPNLPDGSTTNANLELYTEAMAERVAVFNATHPDSTVLFVDLLRPTLAVYERSEAPLTINGIHLNDEGYQALAVILDEALFGPRPEGLPADLERLHAEVLEKDRQFYYDYRAVNGYYIYGGRKEPFGVVNFPVEFTKLRKMIAKRDQRIWAVARGEDVPAAIDDSDTGELPEITSNVPGEVEIISPGEAFGTFSLPEGYRIELVASEADFPDLMNPCQLAFDGRGRIWVCTMPSYPMYQPGVPVDDKILILEDTNGDGRADKQTVFADGLHIPTGIELGYGGVFVSQQPNLMFLRDLDGDDVADERSLVLHGFDSADSHHALSAFTWGPGGALYFQEGTFHHTQVETPYGPERVKNAAVFRYHPRTEQVDVFISYPFANPWGHVFDGWGQNFVADASGGANYFGTAFSGDVNYPTKHDRLKQFLVKQWRPTSGCEIVSSRHFPEETQGDYLINNVIGFQGVLRYRMREEGSGFFAEPVEPLLRSSDPAFRPVDLQFGPDGALYLVDWYNPLIGHMQHSLRDPKRDTVHGRIWRIVHEDRPLLAPPTIDDAPLDDLFALLTAFEDRTRYRVRRELGQRPTAEVLEGLDGWIQTLETNDWHHLLEALWVQQHHNAVDLDLLTTLLNGPEARARAAATRVLCYSRDHVDNALERLRLRVNDEHPRVRLEAVRALSFFEGEQALLAQEIALEALLYDLDDYLEYTLNETNKTLDQRIQALQAN